VGSASGTVNWKSAATTGQRRGARGQSQRVRCGKPRHDDGDPTGPSEPSFALAKVAAGSR